MSGLIVSYRCAANFLKAMQDFSHESKGHIYHLGLQTRHFRPTDTVEEGYKKCTIGDIAGFIVGCVEKIYAKHHLRELEGPLIELKHRLEIKRSCNLLKKIWIIFLFSLYNWYQGMGFHDSLWIVKGCLYYLQSNLEKPIVTPKTKMGKIEGNISFTEEDKAFLLEAFSEKNVLCLKEDTDVKKLWINGQPANLTNNHRTCSVEFERFPGMVFQFESNYWKVKFLEIKQAQAICKNQTLNRIVFPEFS